MKASEHYFSVVLFITLYKMVLTFESFESWSVIIQMTALEHTLLLVLFVLRQFSEWNLSICPVAN